VGSIWSTGDASQVQHFWICAMKIRFAQVNKKFGSGSDVAGEKNRFPRADGSDYQARDRGFKRTSGSGRAVVTRTVTVEQPTVDTFVRSLDKDRFQLIEKKGDKEVYLDKQTGDRWRVEVKKVTGH
jgi:hypothetical protein